MLRTVLADVLVPVVATASASICILLAYFYVTSKPRQRSHKGYPVGLYNLGNTCFINALLQAYSSLPELCSWLSLQNAEHEGPLPASSVLHALSALLSELNTCSEEPTSAERLLCALQAHKWALTAENEQDCDELMSVLNVSIAEELQQLAALKSSTPEIGFELTGSGDAKPRLTSTAGHAWPIEGLLATILVCKSCGYRRVKHEQFTSLKVPLVGDPGGPFPHEQSIYACLWKSFNGEHCFLKCDSKACREKSESPYLKCQAISKLPRCLVVHIQRVKWSSESGGLYKNFSRIQPPDILNVRQFCMYRSAEHPHANGVNGLGVLIPDVKYGYRLSAVINHTGSCHSGHFFTYKKGIQGSKFENSWFFVSDTSVRKLRTDEQRLGDAYMLFYQRI